ncbi:MAG: EAL domain-containing protein, partial [Lachnospiraceae bacterium]|nr:EAL domain-containing protein [Lachnospiraceae bacterium]
MEREAYVLTHFEQAVENGWIQVYYQPVVRAYTKRVCGAEALARWIDPEEGNLAPGQFIPVLEKN